MFLPMLGEVSSNNRSSMTYFLTVSTLILTQCCLAASFICLSFSNPLELAFPYPWIQGIVGYKDSGHMTIQISISYLNLFFPALSLLLYTFSATSTISLSDFSPDLSWLYNFFLISNNDWLMKARATGLEFSAYQGLYVDRVGKPPWFVWIMLLGFYQLPA